jgi:hypothetical protein
MVDWIDGESQRKKVRKKNRKKSNKKQEKQKKKRKKRVLIKNVVFPGLHTVLLRRSARGLRVYTRFCV